MKRPWVPILIFSIAFAIFVLGPPFLDQTFAPYDLMRVADVLDLFTPLVLIPLYWLLFDLDRSGSASGARIAFMVFASFWVLGQGMHLAANSIGHLLEGMENTDAFRLTEFYDETLSHYLWHFGVISLSGCLIYRQWRNPLSNTRRAMAPLVIAGIIYGFTFFAMAIEGVTFPMMLPLALLAAVATFILGRKRFGQQPLLFTFFVGYSVAVLLFAVWGIWQHGFPEFSEVGII